jgi:D-3-phosphoglycerate dehydrogenase
VSNLKKVALVSVSGSAPGLPPWVKKELGEHGLNVEYLECKTKDELAAFASDAEIVWVFGGSTVLSQENLPVLRKCRVILRSGTGTDNVAVDEATRRGILVANTPLAACNSVSDHAIGLLFAAIRQIPAQDRAIRRGIYDRYHAPVKWHLPGMTLGLLGFGRIARLVAKKMSVFGVKLIAFDPFVESEKMSAEGVRPVTLEELFAQSDFLSVHCPLAANTRHIVNAARLKSMKPASVLINTSRGPVIDEGALIQALREGWIAAAALDVLESEPPAPDNPLLKMDNVILTPHISGDSDTLFDDFWRHSVDTLIELAHGRPPHSCVNASMIKAKALAV